ncbi:hypothetical protein [Haloparvum sp. PAK95]|uniref:hypothetical protein n=1 Tax=Haloparvum sp. PAK95 TaxID=3418962 RepID=UPI003D2EE391
MSEFIEPGVREVRGSDSHSQITLLVGYSEDIDEFVDAVSELDIEDFETVGRTTFRVTLPEADVDQLCETDGVISVELDNNDVYTLESQDFQSQTGSMM